MSDLYAVSGIRPAALADADWETMPYEVYAEDKPEARFIAVIFEVFGYTQVEIDKLEVEGE